jgi:gamma-glutamylcyclotransferase (GGCT)/AIG2-like uncharacterized protein YtfP
VNASLFVYGTLRRGARPGASQLLERGATCLGPARTRGRLYDVGRYPGLVPSDDPAAFVRGEVHVLADPAVALEHLDRYEGCAPDDARPHEYERVEREVVLDSGAVVAAWVYLYARPIDGLREIRSGDWLVDRESRRLRPR